MSIECLTRRVIELIHFFTMFWTHIPTILDMCIISVYLTHCILDPVVKQEQQRLASGQQVINSPVPMQSSGTPTQPIGSPIPQSSTSPLPNSTPAWIDQYSVAWAKMITSLNWAFKESVFAMSVFRYQTQKSWLLSPFWLGSERAIKYST